MCVDKFETIRVLCRKGERERVRERDCNVNNTKLLYITREKIQLFGALISKLMTERPSLWKRLGKRRALKRGVIESVRPSLSLSLSE